MTVGIGELPPEEILPGEAVHVYVKFGSTGARGSPIVNKVVVQVSVEGGPALAAGGKLSATTTIEACEVHILVGLVMTIE